MSLPTFPPPLQPAAHLRLAYTREESLSPSRLPPTSTSTPSSASGAPPPPSSARRFSHSRGRPRALGASSVSRERSASTTRTATASEWGGCEWDYSSERGRSVSSSRTGREGSRAPLFRVGGEGAGRGVERSVSRVRGAAGEKSARGGGGEKSEENGRGGEEGREGWAGRLGRLGRHFVGVRGDRAFPTPLLPFLRHLPLSIETPFLTFLGVFPSLLICAGISTGLSRSSGAAWSDTPLTFGSLGATAVLLYAVPEGPLSQPRNCWGGHMISALVGCIISQLFSISPRFTYSLAVPGADNEVASMSSWESLTPVAAALAVGLAVLAMQLTGTIHPPGGATALIAAYHLRPGPRWTYLVVVFLSVSAMGIWAMLINNLGRRRYPAYWWTPPPPNPTSPSPSPPSPPLSKSATQHIEHSTSHPHSHTPSLSPERDLQQRWLGRLGEVDEEALAGGEYEDADEGVGRERGEGGEEGREEGGREGWEEEERGRRETRRT